MIFDLFSKRASLENPNDPISQSLAEYLDGGGTSSSGISVNHTNALGLSSVWACIRVISEGVSSLPINVYRRLPDGGREIAHDHPVQKLIKNPNEFMTSFTFRETVQSHISNWGNGYAAIIRMNSQRPAELLPLDPSKTYAKREGGKLFYITDIDGKKHKINAIDMIHVPGLGFDGITGYSPITMHRNAIGLGMAADEYAGRFFANDATPKGVIEHPSHFKDSESFNKFKNNWQDSQGGSNRHKTAILQDGMKYTQISLAPNDAQFIETKKYSVTDIARIFRVPPHMIGDLERSTFSNIEQQALEFVKYTLLPWLIRWEQELNRKLFTEREKESGEFFIKHSVDGLLRGDINSRYDAYGKGINSGFITRNEARELEDMNKLDGLDEVLIPLNMASADQSEETPDDSSDTEENSFIAATIKRVVLREQSQIREAFDKYRDTPDKTNAWFDSFIQKQRHYLADNLNIEQKSADLLANDLKNLLISDKMIDNLNDWEEIRSIEINKQMSKQHGN